MMRTIARLIRENPYLERIAVGASQAFVLRTIGFGLNFVFSVVMVRLAGPDGSGLFYLSFSIVALAAAISQLGLADTVLRFISAEVARENWSGVAGISRKSRNAILFSASLLCGLLLLIAPLFAGLFDEPQLVLVLRLMALAVLPLALSNVYAAKLRSIERVFASMLVSSVMVPLMSLLLTIPFASIWSINGIAVAYTGAAVVTCLIAFAMWYRYTPLLRGISGEYGNAILINTARPLFWVTVLGSLLSTIDTTILGVFTSTAQVGIYSVARRAVSLVQFIILAINVVVAPRFSVLYSQQRMEEFRQLARSVALLTLLMAIPALFPFFVFPELILSIFGGAFITGAPVLVILAFGQLIDMSTGTVTYLLIMTGHERAVRNTMVLTVLTSLIGMVILTARAGIVGAAISMVLTTIVLNAVAVWQVYHHLSFFVLPLPPVIKFIKLVGRHNRTGDDSAR